MYIISQDKKHLINLDHIVSIDVAQTGPSVEVAAKSAHSLTGEEHYVLGIFEDEKQAAMILEFIAFCKCKSPEKITVIPPVEEVKAGPDIADVLNMIFKGKGREPDGHSGGEMTDDFLEKLFKGVL